MKIVPSPKATPRTKYSRELLKRLPHGYVIAYGKAADDENTRRHVGSHPLLFAPDGSVVRHADGRPFTVSLTPSDARAPNNMLAALRRLGVPVK